MKPASVDEASVLDRLRTWGEAEPLIRAMVLTSTRAKPNAPVDALSDYDVILFVADAERFSRDDAWQSIYGQPMVRWGDEKKLYGFTIYFRGVVYEDGVKIDYSIWPDQLVDVISEQPSLPDQLDVGYRVLLDKGARTSSWKEPTYLAHIPVRPTEAEYRALVDEFWWGTTYVSKGLWRDEVVHAKFVLDHEVKFVTLRRFLEWRTEVDHDWSLKPGAYGRGIERLLPADMWSDLATTYVGTRLEDNWNALFRTIELFRRVATEVGNALGFAYPQEVDDRVTAYLRAVREMPRQPATS